MIKSNKIDVGTIVEFNPMLIKDFNSKGNIPNA